MRSSDTHRRALVVVACCVSACSIDFGALQGGASPSMDGAAPDAPLDAGPLPGRDGGPAPGCPPIADRPEVTIEHDLSTDTTWSCDTQYRLLGPVLVAGATLTIEPGARIVAEPGAYLAIARDARIDANGTQDDPIVLTSAGAAGSREAWRGLKLLGRAPVGDPATPTRLQDDPRLEIGGGSSDHDCGRLRYVRIELAGREADEGGLELGGCGRSTRLDFVQVHGADSHALRVLGGEVDLRHVLISAPSRGGLRWSLGWTGRAQHIVVLGSGRPSIDARDVALVHGASGPGRRSSPTLLNLTLVSAGRTRSQAGLFFEDATDASLRNVLLRGQLDGAVVLFDVEAAERAATHPATLSLERSMLFGMGTDPADYFTAPAREDPEQPHRIDEVTWVSRPEASNRFGDDPLLPRPESPVEPVLVPPLGSPVGVDAAVPENDGFFDPSAAYVGAFEPAGIDWTEGWAAYPPR